MKKRIFFLAFLLIICLLCGMFPLTAMAEETTMGDRPPLPTRESLVVYEGTFQEAFREGMTLKEALSSDHVKSVNDHLHDSMEPDGYLDDPLLDLGEFYRYAYEPEYIFGKALEKMELHEVYALYSDSLTSEGCLMIYYVTDWGDFILCLETTNAYALHQMFLFPFADYNRIICQRRNEYEAAYLESISDPSAEIVHTTVRSWICFQGLMTGAELRFYHWEEMRAQLESSDDWRQHTPKTSDLYTWGGKKTEPVETPVWAINAAASNDEGETTEPPLGTSAKNPVSPWIWGISLTVLFTAAVAVSFFLGTKRGKQSVKQT